MDREATYGGVDPEIFEAMRTSPAPTECTLVAEIHDEELYSLPISEREADELGQILMDLEAAGEQP